MEFTAEQQYLLNQMHMKFSAMHTSLELLNFVSKELGEVNSFTCTFRKFIQKYQSDFSDSQQAVHDAGIVDILADRILD